MEQAVNPGAPVVANPEEADSLRERLELAEAGWKDRSSQVTRLEAQLAERETATSALNDELTRSGEQLKGKSAEAAAILAGYKQLLLGQHPDIPPELVGGTTLEELNSSLGRARELVARVRQGLEAEASRLRVPPGTPLRAAPDFSALTAREKIQQAIGGK